MVFVFKNLPLPNKLRVNSLTKIEGPVIFNVLSPNPIVVLAAIKTVPDKITSASA